MILYAKPITHIKSITANNVRTEFHMIGSPNIDNAPEPKFDTFING